MANPLPNYLKTYRKRSGFTQDEMAFLLGCQSGAKVSRYEHFKRQPSLNTVFAYQIVFKIPTNNLFSGIYQKAEVETFKKVESLIKRLEKVPSDVKTIRKIEILKSIISRSS